MLKLGTQTGSVVNHLHSRTTNPTPEIGMGATISYWTDREAGTVVLIEGSIVVIRGVRAVRTDGLGMTDAQSYRYEEMLDGPTSFWKLDAKGRYRRVSKNENGRWVYLDGKHGPHLSLGFRDAYHDYSF